MSGVTISFGEQNVIVRNGERLFARRQPMRFEFLALLALKRLTLPSDQAGATLDQVARLPAWKGRPKHHVSTNIGRYLQAPEVRALVKTDAPWTGPYSLAVDSLAISFDIPLREVRRRLGLRSAVGTVRERESLLQFARSYARAQWLFFRGMLRRSRKNLLTDDAYERLMRLTGNNVYSPNLRLLALISAADVLYRLGQFRIARQALADHRFLLRIVPDLSLKARFHLSLAWARQRSSTGRRSDRGVEAALAVASSFAENSGDRAALALLAYRRGGYLTKKRRHVESIESLAQAMEAYLITGNYHGVQSACGEIGSVMHRQGADSYGEARRWLLASIGIARLMKLGRDDAHAEMILGKIHVEEGKRTLAHLMLSRAERISANAGNRVNFADTKMVWGFWYQRFGTPEEEIATLTEAVRLFRSMAEFDVAQKEHYMQHRFPEVWDAVVRRSSPKSL